MDRFLPSDFNLENVVSPSIDVVFKALFGNEKNKALLASLVSSVTGIAKEDIDNLEILNSELLVSFHDEKAPRLDVRARLRDGTDVDIEIHYIELRKLQGYNKTQEEDLLIDWVEFLSIKEGVGLMALKDRELPEEILKAFEELEELSKNPEMREIALSREIGLRDELQRLYEAEERGRGEGFEQGEKKKSLEIVKILKVQGVSVDIIAIASGLSVEEIETL